MKYELLILWFFVFWSSGCSYSLTHAYTNTQARVNIFMNISFISKIHFFGFTEAMFATKTQYQKFDKIAQNFLLRVSYIANNNAVGLIWVNSNTNKEIVRLNAE